MDVSALTSLRNLEAEIRLAEVKKDTSRLKELWKKRDPLIKRAADLLKVELGIANENPR